MAECQEQLKTLLETPLELRCVRGDLPDKVALFNKHVEQHNAVQKKNPFSGHVEGGKPVLDKHDPNYGRPVEGSKTDLRGKKAMNHICKEMLELCEIIHDYGSPVPGEPAHIYISFGELFNIYTKISNKVVGILLRARKHGYLHFEGETLFQRRDDDVPVILTKSIKEIREAFRKSEAETHST